MFPGAGYLAMIAAASSATQGLVLEDIVFKSALVFEDKEQVKKTNVVLTSAPSKTSASVSVSIPFYFYS